MHASVTHLTLTMTGAAVQLTAIPIVASEIHAFARSGNTDAAYWGDVTAQPHELPKGLSVPILLSDPTLVYVTGTASDIVTVAVYS